MAAADANVLANAGAVDSNSESPDTDRESLSSESKLDVEDASVHEQPRDEL